MNQHIGLVLTGAPLMPEIVADPTSPSCSQPVFRGPESDNLNSLLLISFCFARYARGRRFGAGRGEHIRWLDPATNAGIGC
jgi:hypothetical protein